MARIPRRRVFRAVHSMSRFGRGGNARPVNGSWGRPRRIGTGAGGRALGRRGSTRGRIRGRV